MSKDMLKLRTISYNVQCCYGFVSRIGGKGRFAPQEQWPSVRKKLAKELAGYDADIITFCESPEEKELREIARVIGLNCVFFPSTEKAIDSQGNWYWCPGGLLTRFDVIDCKLYPGAPTPGEAKLQGAFSRHWGFVKLRLPNGQILTVHSAHLMPFDKYKHIREYEISKILSFVREDIARGEAVLLQGDLNHSPEDKEYLRWVDSGLVDTFYNEAEVFTAFSNNPCQRLDYIFAGGRFGSMKFKSKVLREGAFIIPECGSESMAISDHMPVMCDIWQ